MTLNIGDVVQLKSGGPLMTVIEKNSDLSVLCLWFNNGTPQPFQSEFPIAALSLHVESSGKVTISDSVSLWS